MRVAAIVEDVKIRRDFDESAQRAARDKRRARDQQSERASEQKSQVAKGESEPAKRPSLLARLRDEATSEHK